MSSFFVVCSSNYSRCIYLVFFRVALYMEKVSIQLDPDGQRYLMVMGDEPIHDEYQYYKQKIHTKVDPLMTFYIGSLTLVGLYMVFRVLY